ncbi:hypothetical protein M501DRAFT_997348 [Patellaria atrata CBS 101060]|uniref:Delta(24)-sterol reductase n=1 Tax=Patellaria atrata CBS 101060 TaxID=1346257 RepID=A0A9P4S4K0_9PEZI|nr:hypothetical protein M501DRAFT_997348 [Patellaria atrata CBS 101060]
MSSSRRTIDDALRHEHDNAVGVLGDKIAEFSQKSEKFRVFHGSTNSTRITHFEREKMLDLTSFTRIIEIDVEKKIALVEPNVPMDELVKATLEYSLVPPVVMEFPGITVGGGFAGTGGESSSFRYGFFNKIVNWIEIILATGERVKASPTQLPDLFFGAAGSFGTLGVITLLEVQLISAKRFVQLQYTHVESLEQAIQEIDSAMEEKSMHIDYIDGILYSRDSGMIMLGTLTDEFETKSPKVRQFSRKWDPWFYLHVQKLGKQHQEPVTEYIPLVDYLFRYDRGAFWTGRYAFKRFHAPFNSATRFLLDPLLHTRKMYQALNVSGYSQQYIIQDLAMPFGTVQRFIEYVDEDLGIYPLWLCPLKMDSAESVPLRAKIGIQSHHDTPTEGTGASTSSVATPKFLLNVGVWGPGPRVQDRFAAVNRALEAKVRELGGFKWLYANAYYTEQEFWSIYNREWYEELREKYGAAKLPSVYDKVKAKEFKGKVNVVSGIRGILAAVRGGTGHLFSK